MEKMTSKSSSYPFYTTSGPLFKVIYYIFIFLA